MKSFFSTQVALEKQADKPADEPTAEETKDAKGDIIAAARVLGKDMGETFKLIAQEGDTVDMLEASTPMPIGEDPAADIAATTAMAEGYEAIPADSLMVGSPEAEAEIDDELSVGGEGDFFAATSQAEMDINEEAEVEAVMESMEQLAGRIRHLITTQTYSQESADMSTFAAQTLMSRLGLKLPGIGLESGGQLSALVQHQLAMEGLMDVVNRFAQATVVSAKRTFNAYYGPIDEQGIVKKYRTILAKGIAEYNTVKGEFKAGQHTGSLADVWQFFSTGAGPALDPAKALEKDLAANSYILLKYPSLVLDQIKKVCSIISQTPHPKTEADILRVVDQMATLQRPVELFDRSMLSGKETLLGRVSLEVNETTARTVLNYNGKTYPKVAHLATLATVRESTAAAHQVKRLLMTGSVAGATIRYQNEDIAAVLNAGLGYLANVEKAKGLLEQIQRQGEIMVGQINLFVSSANSIEALRTNKELNALGQQALAVGPAIFNAAYYPAQSEVHRVLRGARYCSYLGLRMIANAK